MDRISVVVGSGHSCDLRLPGPYLSTRHFEIYGTPGNAFCRDLGSMNGTMVKTYLLGKWERALSPQPVQPGSSIVAGRVLIRVEMDGRVTCKPSLSPQELMGLMLP